jgi:hypothetical protein
MAKLKPIWSNDYSSTKTEINRYFLIMLKEKEGI